MRVRDSLTAVALAMLFATISTGQIVSGVMTVTGAEMH